MSYFDYTTDGINCQEHGDKLRVLHDTTGGGRERPWDVHKRQSRKIAALYRYIDDHKAEMMEQCADWLAYQRDGEGYRLSKANFCRVRLCPMCQWRRSLKIYGQMSRICDNIDWTRYAAVHLTLTVRNCAPQEITETLDKITEGWHRLIKYKDVSAAVKGSYRALEITVNNNTASDAWGTLHPHIHALLLVNKSYFASRNYISHDKWIDLWARACQLDYRPDVKVYKVYVREGETINDALRELTKYTTKAKDITTTGADPVELLQVLDDALKGRRLLGLSGVFRDLHKRLNLTEIESDADLIHVGEDAAALSDDQRAEIYYIWRSGVYVEWTEWTN